MFERNSQHRHIISVIICVHAPNKLGEQMKTLQHGEKTTMENQLYNGEFACLITGCKININILT